MLEVDAKQWPHNMLRSIALLTFFSYYAVKKITFCAMIIISTKNVKQLKSENNNRDCISFLFRRIEVWPQMSRSLSIQFFQLQKDYCDMFHFFTISIKWSRQHCKFTFPNITTQKVADIELRSKAILTMFVNDVFFSKSFISIIPHLFIIVSVLRSTYNTIYTCSIYVFKCS